MSDRDPRAPSRRRSDRVAAASVRAVAGDATAEIRGGRLELDRRPLQVFVPALSFDLAGSDPSRRRRVCDALGVRARHSDPTLHEQLRPAAGLGRALFDALEQVRCEALVPPHLPGVRANTADAFADWSDWARSERVAENRAAMLVFCIVHMARARVLGGAPDEAAADLIEAPRATLGPLIGSHLVELAGSVSDQAAFGRIAAEVARRVAGLAGDAELDADDARPGRVRLFTPLGWDTVAEAGVGGLIVAGTGCDDYRVWSRAGDRVVDGASVCPPGVIDACRRDLDALVAGQTISVARLAQRLRPLFASAAIGGWSSEDEEGELDPARLARLVADPLSRRARRQPVLRPSGDAAISFLLDTSGSMKRKRHEALAAMVVTLSRASELAGATPEVLAFTTASWTGGRAADAWRRAGRPSDPGRLAELLHVVHQPAGMGWRRARRSLASLLHTDHYRESIDGEALEWAARRLLTRPERRRMLVLISDGIPADAATVSANREGYLADHLAGVVDDLTSGPAALELAAIVVGRQPETPISNAVRLDLDKELTMDHYDVLHRLFGPEARARRSTPSGDVRVDGTAA